MADLINRRIDEIVAIDIGHDMDVERIELLLQFSYPGMDGLEHLRRDFHP